MSGILGHFKRVFNSRRKKYELRHTLPVSSSDHQVSCRSLVGLVTSGHGWARVNVFAWKAAGDHGRLLNVGYVLSS